MLPRTVRLTRCSILICTVMCLVVVATSGARADALYTITDLGTLSGQSSSAATSINNQGQVVGISYNSSDGYFASNTSGPAEPPRFVVAGSGAQSFLYGNGQITQINPVGGLAGSINDSGQVVGGPYASINNNGQYVGGAASGVDNNYSLSNQLVSGTTTTALQMAPYAINNAGEIAGFVILGAHGGTDIHPAIYQNGQVTDLFSTVGSGQYFYGNAVAIDQKGDLLITTWQLGGTTQSYLYHQNNGTVTDLTNLPGGSGFIAAALNNNGQAVGNGFLYNNGTVETLLSVLSAGSGWSNLNATGINDDGQIVGQGTYDGQQLAFLMTPDAIETPEPATIVIWGLIALGTIARARAGGKRNRRVWLRV